MAGTDPIHQFVITDIFELFTLGGDGAEVSGTTFAFTIPREAPAASS